MLVYFVAIWSILRPFGTFCVPLVYFMVMWYIFLHLVYCTKKKSGNPDSREDVAASLSAWKSPTDSNWDVGRQVGRKMSCHSPKKWCIERWGLLTGSATRLGEFSPTGWVFTLGSFLENFKSRQKNLATFYHRKKLSLGYILGDSLTNASGHPANWLIRDALLVLQTRSYSTNFLEHSSQ
jgi:hypothetical protein